MNIIWLLKRLNVKSIIFNFRLLPYRKAIRFPILINSKTDLKLRRKELFNLDAENLYFGMIRIGYSEVGIISKNEPTIIEIMGQIIFKGRAYIGKGSKISVMSTGILELGNNFTITAASTIICRNRITVGNNCLMSWGITIIDTDFHKIYDEEEHLINADAPITLGNNVWVGFNATILKGAQVNNNVIISANAILTSGKYSDNSIIAGNPGKEVKSFFRWEI